MKLGIDKPTFCILYPFYVLQQTEGARHRVSHQRCSMKKLFLKILQYSQENLSNKVAGRPVTLLKRDSNTDVFR